MDKKNEISIINPSLKFMLKQMYHNLLIVIRKIKNKIKKKCLALYLYLKSNVIFFDYKEIPVIIINFNQLFYLKQLIDFLLKRNFKNIVIIDNNSTYPPLLKYYNEIQTKATIHRLDVNEGHFVFWKRQDLFEKYTENYYVITDPDILLNENLPSKFLNYFKILLDRYAWATKVGVALQIDDIPDSFIPKSKVIHWEHKFWADKIFKDVYKADIDTTFALYRPKYLQDANFYAAIRVAGNFTAKHGGWYIDYENMTEEQLYYVKTSNSSSSWKVDINGNLMCNNYDF